MRRARQQSYKPALEITRLEENGPQPVSVAQDQMVRIERDLPGLPQFNLPFAFRLKGPLNVPALNWSLVEVMRAHEALRTGFAWMKEQPVARHRGAGRYRFTTRRRRCCSLEGYGK